MPHTSRKKKIAPNRRRQVVDEDGWTRVTTSGALSTSAFLANDDLARGQQNLHFKWGIDGRFVNINSRLPVPQKIHPGVSLEKMQARYRNLEAKWLESASYAALQTGLSKDRVAQKEGGVSKCVIFGSGSFSAAILGREDVSFYQIAAFKSAIDIIEQVQGHRPSCYAQEPYYTELDGEFLAALGISVVEHPKGFELVDDTSFAYSPCAERWVELQAMYNQPRLWLHACLQDRWPLNEDGTPSIGQPLNWMLFRRVLDPENPDWSAVYGPDLEPGDGERLLQEEYIINHQLYEAFKQSHRSFSLPDLDASNYPFQSCAIHWPVEGDESLAKAVTNSEQEVPPLPIQDESGT